MSGILVTCMLALALAIIVVRRRSVAIALLAAQSLALGIGALDLAGGRSEDFLVAASSCSARLWYSRCCSTR